MFASSIQGKRRRPIRACHSTAHGFMGPLEQVTDLDKSYYPWISDEGPPSSHPTKVGPIRGRSKVGRPTRSADLPTAPIDLSLRHGSSPLVLDVGSMRLHPKSRPRRGWLPPINSRGGVRKRTHHQVGVHIHQVLHFNPSLGLELS